MPKRLNSRLILGSNSPRRKMLLEQAGFDFEVIPPDDSVEPANDSEDSAEKLVLRSSFVKAQHIAKQVDSGVIIAADTVAECHGKILGKPVDKNHAREMLTEMSHTEHRVLTGVTLWHKPSDIHETYLESTRLRMDAMPAQKFEAYLESGDWKGKAGAFGYQDGLDWVHIIEGTESNVVGLPMENLEQKLTDLLTRIT